LQAIYVFTFDSLGQKFRAHSHTFQSTVTYCIIEPILPWDSWFRLDNSGVWFQSRCGKDIDGLQDKLITIIKSACSKPIKAKPNGPAKSTENPSGKKKNKQEE
jgi:hypothetical protein